MLPRTRKAVAFVSKQLMSVMDSQQQQAAGGLESMISLLQEYGMAVESTGLFVEDGSSSEDRRRSSGRHGSAQPGTPPHMRALGSPGAEGSPEAHGCAGQQGSGGKEGDEIGYLMQQLELVRGQAD